MLVFLWLIWFSQRVASISGFRAVNPLYWQHRSQTVDPTAKGTMRTTSFAVLAGSCLCVMNLLPAAALAQGTAFTYQGRLNTAGSPANGNYDFAFTLWSTNSGGSQIGGAFTNARVEVANGLFTVMLDFGSGIYTGQSVWLQVNVETNGVGPYVPLTPRQPLTPTPYSVYAASAGGVTNASISAGQLNTLGAPSMGQVLIFNGSNLEWTNSVPGGSGWSLTGNAGTTPGTDFLGTSDDEPLELWVNAERAFRLEPGNGNPNVIGGSGSSAAPAVAGGTIAGGIQNSVSNAYPTVGGGEYNHATANGALVGGGYDNSASGEEAVVGGGAHNAASGPGAFVGGGGYDGTILSGNSASNPAATVGGGLQNAASGSYATVGGGSLNTANGLNAAIPGGYFNTASGAYSFAAGYGAEAQNPGAFVWADNSGSFFPSTANNQFSVRAYGGVKIVTGGAGMTIDGVPVSTGGGGSGGGSGWSLSGNAGTDPGVNFLGTTDDVGLELHVDSLRGIGLYPAQQGPQGPNNDTDAGINVTGGFWENYISSAVVGATIAGGGEQHYDDVNGAENFPNEVTGNFGTVGGGFSNTAGYGGTVPGGMNNLATGDGSFAAGQQAQALHAGAFAWADSQNAPFASTGNDQFCIRAQGGMKLDNSTSVAFGSATRQMLELYRDPTSTYIYGIGVQSSTFYERAGVGGGFAWYSGGVHNDNPDNNGGGNTLMTLDGSGNLNVAANASVCTLTIRGGCDVAEPFVMSASAVTKGSVVVIDEQHPGQLKLSDRPYDTRVAGIVSGANGINPGLALHQAGALADGQNVALSGRVYVLADASGSPITPGDLLTTSESPGYAMKVTDHARAQGAILGKAMTGLKEGKGVVLVLVTLQ